LVVACAPETGLSARDILQSLLAPLGGRGGGDGGLAQGGCTTTEQQFNDWAAGAAELLQKGIMD
jgi:hypothetical protein